MITADNLSKRFGRVRALNSVSCCIPDACVWGLVGSNGAGKSTFLRLLAGIYRPDSGTLAMDGQPIYENTTIKAQLALVCDDLYALPGASLARMAALQRAAYPRFDAARFDALCEAFRLKPDRPLHTLSKGMRRQAAFALALSSRARYLLLDETFDGLDPVMRNLARKLVYEAVCDDGATAVLTSHSLRELEDTCDQLALLHEGGLVLQSDVSGLKNTLCKVQVGFGAPFEESAFAPLGLEILRCRQLGSVAHLMVRGAHEEVLARLRGMQPLLCELLPLTLEEIFIHEMEGLGYTADPAPLRTTRKQEAPQ